MSLPRATVRPGERREPLPSLQLNQIFAEAATAHGLSIPAATEVTLERALVAADLKRFGDASLYRRLVARATTQRFESPLPAAYAVYMGAIRDCRGRNLTLAELEQPIAVPLRFFPRVLTIDFDEALTADGFADAIILELAALCVGRTMSEYALLFAAASAAPEST